eukprot:GHUV01021643.1.p1 GENE.GHUV01021643.1~~GHUV01021643.1.p1  ORF type:complete len:610 (+),score=106.89 GHUV01021643.1:124-1953(+)
MDPPLSLHSGHLPILQLPNGVLQHGVTRWLSLSDCATLAIASKELKLVVEVALKARKRWHSSDRHEVSHMKASRLFKFLARHSPNLTHITCCFAADRLYGGSLLESSLSSLAASTANLTHLTLLNVDVTDVVLQALAKHCLGLQHVAIGRTENNAFGNFVSDEGLAALAVACRGLRSLYLFRCYSCSDAGLRELVAQGRQLTRLVLHSCPQVTTSGLVSFLEASTSLQELDILLPESGSGGTAVNFETCFALAANCSDLRVLRLSEELVAGSVLDDSCLTLVARGCNKLQELELVQIEVSDAFLTTLASHCTSLTSLRLEQTYVGDEGVHRVLAACPHLQNLRVAGCSPHTWMLPAEFMFPGLSISGFSRMSQLAISNPAFGARLTDLDLSCLALEPLEATEAAAAASVGSSGLLPAIGSSVALATHAAAAIASAAAANATISSVAQATQQSAFDIQSAAAAAAAPQLILPIAWCNRLTSLSLDWLKVDGQPLQIPLENTLSHCNNLSRLSLVGYQGNVDRLLASVAAAGGSKQASGLRQLNLQHSQITDQGLAAVVKAFPQLSALYLGYCRNVGDQGLMQLLGMKGLVRLDLFNTPCVSAGAVADLAR